MFAANADNLAFNPQTAPTELTQISGTRCCS